jgi:hypothetical protein
MCAARHVVLRKGSERPGLVSRAPPSGAEPASGMLGIGEAARRCSMVREALGRRIRMWG